MGLKNPPVKGNRMESRRNGTSLVRVCPCWILNRVDPAAAVIWMELHSLEAYGSSATVSPGVKFLGDTVGVSRDTVLRAIKELENIGALRVWRRSNRTSIYQTVYDDPQRSEVEQQVLSLDVAEDGVDTAPVVGNSNHKTSVQSQIPTGPVGISDTKQELLESSLRSDSSATRRGVSRGLTTKELIGAFQAAWRTCGLGEYVVTGKDRGVLTSHLNDFDHPDEALSQLESRIRWAMKREFWAEHLCMRSVLEVVANQMALREGVGRVGGTSQSTGPRLVGDLLEEYRSIAMEGGGLSPEMAAVLGLQERSSSGDTAHSPKGTPAAT